MVINTNDFLAGDENVAEIKRKQAYVATTEGQSIQPVSKEELDELITALPKEEQKFWKENKVANAFIKENVEDRADKVRFALQPGMSSQIKESYQKIVDKIMPDMSRMSEESKEEVYSSPMLSAQFSMAVSQKIAESEFGTKTVRVPAGSELKDAPVEGLFSTIKASGKEAIAAVLGPIKSGYSRVTGAILNRKVQESKIHS